LHRDERFAGRCCDHEVHLRNTWSGAIVVGVLAVAAMGAVRQAPHHEPAGDVGFLQPFGVSARRVVLALAQLGQPLSDDDRAALESALASSDARDALTRATAVLDRLSLATVTINPEARVTVRAGAARPALVEAGTRVFLVKVINQAGITAPLSVTSPQSGRVSMPAWNGGEPDPPRTITDKDIEERWAEVSFFDKPPIAETLSGIPLEYRILEIYSRDRGQRTAELKFDVGQGTADLAYRSDLPVTFTAAPSRRVSLRIEDERGRPALARLTVRDAADRVYPGMSKRLAPDLPFQPQVYRSDGEGIVLPDGRYRIAWSGGPEYVTGTREITVGDGQPDEITIRLARWIDPASRGWFSGDHHVHAAGCAHYQDPAQGVGPDDIVRQIKGEGLNVGSILTWGPCYYHQRQFFSGKDDERSTDRMKIRYDLEVSGFPSSHAGHLVLLGLKQQEYPGTTRIEEWPTWTMPILKWAKQQGAVTGYAHSGWGLQIAARDIPADEVPKFDGIGANEFIVTVTEPDTVDFISSVDTPWPWELNIWYHVLNVGFRTRLSGETDFPCIYDDRVGLGRTYAKLDRLTFEAWLTAIRTGRSYVSDGRSHLMDFAVDGVGVGTRDVVSPNGRVHVTLNAASMLDEIADTSLATRDADQKPFWDAERARVPGSREVRIEFIVNGRPVETRRLTADGVIRPIEAGLTLTRSAWIAARILPSAHTNPIWVEVEGKPMRPTRQSARWCLAAVDQCWLQKRDQIKPGERADAEVAYERARVVYRRLLDEGIE
jgi:hypothetical protein